MLVTMRHANIARAAAKIPLLAERIVDEVRARNRELEQNTPTKEG
jgi:hypothetical protein